MKRYVFFTLKRFIPFFVICMAIFFVVSLTMFVNVPVIHEFYENEGMRYLESDLDGAAIIVIVMAVLLFGFTAVSPIIANSYRYSLRSADFYNQIGKGHKNVRLVNNLILLIAVLLSFTFAFIFGSVILGIKNVIAMGQGEIVEYYGDAAHHTIPFMYHYTYLVPIYFMLLIAGVVNYFISYFLVTRANNALNSVMMLVLGQVILFVAFVTPIWYLGLITDGAIEVTYLAGVKTPSMIGVVALTLYLFSSLFNGTGFNSEAFTLTQKPDYVGLVLAILGVLLFFALGVYSMLKFFKEEETSGELAGKPQGRDYLQNIIFHTGAGFIGLWYLSLSGSLNRLGMMEIIGVFSFIPSIVVYGALYYVFYGLLRRNFRLSKKDLAILLPIFIANILLGVTAIIVPNTIYVEY